MPYNAHCGAWMVSFWLSSSSSSIASSASCKRHVVWKGSNMSSLCLLSLPSLPWDNLETKHPTVVMGPLHRQLDLLILGIPLPQKHQVVVLEHQAHHVVACCHESWSQLNLGGHAFCTLNIHNWTSPDHTVLCCTRGSSSSDISGIPKVPGNGWVSRSSIEILRKK